MTWLARSCAIALTLFIASAAQARTLGVISSGDNIVAIRDLLPEEAAALELDSLGYHYQTFGLLGLDFWRWGGEFVAYKTAPEPSVADELHEIARGTIVLDRLVYAPLSDSELEALGSPAVPWSYRCPIGLLLILAVIELWIVARRRRSAGLVLAIGVGLFALAIVLYAKGVTQAFAIPLLLGATHVGVAWLASRRASRDDDLH